MDYYFMAALLIYQGESYRSRPYDDVSGKAVGNLPSGGKITVGIGLNLTDSGISFKEANMILMSRIYDIDTLINTANWFQPLNNARRAALIDMAYNMGVDGLVGFKNTLLAIGQGRWADASAGILSSQYAKQVGKRAVRNAKIIETGLLVFNAV